MRIIVGPLPLLPFVEERLFCSKSIHLIQETALARDCITHFITILRVQTQSMLHVACYMHRTIESAKCLAGCILGLHDEMLVSSSIELECRWSWRAVLLDD